ncbi:syntaxin-binding protein 5 isoform X1 [Lepeophtheirus salmonis]
MLNYFQVTLFEICLTFYNQQDKFVYIGTEKGTLHVLSIESFSLSGYSIPWNKFMDPLSTAQPGSIIIINVNPADPSKILVGFDSGLMVIFDFPSKNGESRYRYAGGKLYNMSWHMDGRQFVSSHGDGSLVTWNVKAPGSIASCNHTKPTSVIFPHAKKDKESGKMCPCDPIDKVYWRVRRSTSESYFVFSGGLPSDVTGVTPSVTVLQGKTTTLLEMEYCVIDFIIVTDSCYRSDYNEPEAIIAMLTNDVVAIDCKTPGFPCFENPYAMNFNESPVTSCHYIVDVPSDFIPCLYRVGASNSNRSFSNFEWPVSGGIDTNTESCSYAELVITGHADGSVRFWDSSSSSMQSLYRIKTAKYFEKVKKNGGGAVEGLDDDPYAINNIRLCPESKILIVSGSAAHIIVFKFRKKDTQTDTISLEIPIIYEVSASRPEPKVPESSPPTLTQHFEFPPRPLLNVASQSSSYADPVEGFNFDKPLHEFFSPLRVRQGQRKSGIGYHPELICLTPWVNGEPPSPINCITVSSAYGLVAYGNNSGLVIVDVIQNVCLLNMGTSDLYGSQDPFHRAPKSPRPVDPSPCKDDFITRVDLSNYSQVVPSDISNSQPSTVSNNYNGDKSSALSRVRSPDCKRLIKTGSSADDSSLSKSSSINSLDNSVITVEGVTAVSFSESFPTKNNFAYNPCLYVGTSLGSVIVVIVNLPSNSDDEPILDDGQGEINDDGTRRLEEPVVVSPSGTVYRIRGSALNFTFLDCSSSQEIERVNVMKPATTEPNSHGDESMKPDRQILVACSDKSASAFSLPSQRTMYSQTINESSSVTSVEVVNFGGSKFNPVLIAYTTDGRVKTYTVPSIRPMLDDSLIPVGIESCTKRVSHTLCFGNYGHGLYFRNPTECQKFTVSADFMRQLPELKGNLFREGVPTPDPPKQNFFKGLFGGGPKPCDRDELFGETSGKPLSGVAKHIPGTAMQNSLSKSVSATNEVSKAKMAMLERGQKLNELEDRTEQMANEAKNYAANAQKLKLAYQNKRWYQM